MIFKELAAEMFHFTRYEQSVYNNGLVYLVLLIVFAFLLLKEQSELSKLKRECPTVQDFKAKYARRIKRQRNRKILFFAIILLTIRVFIACTIFGGFLLFIVAGVLAGALAGPRYAWWYWDLVLDDFFEIFRRKK